LRLLSYLFSPQQPFAVIVVIAPFAVTAPVLIDIAPVLIDMTGVPGFLNVAAR
jgi:hypothetical protein